MQAQQGDQAGDDGRVTVGADDEFVGVALDVAGGRNDPQGWAVAFASLGVVALTTVPIMRRLTATETPS